MGDNLTNKDYIQILTYYKKPIPKSKKMLKIIAEKILGEKLCKCIKKIDPVNEKRSIGICTQTVLNSKGITRGNFNCTGKRKITLKKLKSNKTRKTRK
jgi:hypothetical protein